MLQNGGSDTPKNLRLNIDGAQYDALRPPESPLEEKRIDTSRPRGRSRSFSNVPLPFLSTSNVDSEKSPITPGLSSPVDNQPKPVKAQHESKKLLAHILGQLDRRRPAPSTWDVFKAETAAETEKVRTMRSRPLVGISSNKASTSIENSLRSFSFVDNDSDEDDGELPGSAFTTDHTFDLMCQLKDVLRLAQEHGWPIFTEE